MQIHVQRGEENLGADHPYVATSYHDMAYAYKAKKDLAKAEEYWEKAHAAKKAGTEPSPYQEGQCGTG